ncbi:MAG TPA: transporter substrate-binding domain-containing protein [Oligoflexus sp.]|uniref:transporter substrate-binding domain-containing protein n=1 Tax=Oligoflexus sp. TaxID=1971216 RepID=UPI002D3BAEAF|nr:transporter substrate-binding domain-containing protein [Oligoflexus sp.]HYX33070.1 transporter substrate-binding domain-containing protein [Oligoflexus sp.]
MRRSLCKLILGIASFASTHPTWAADTVTPSPALPVARVSFTNFPPWCVKGSNGQYQGIIVDYLRDLAKDVNLGLREEVVPIARLHHSLSHGKIDLFFSRVPDKGFDCCTSLGKAFDSEIIILGRKSGPEWNKNTDVHSICRTGLSGYSIPGFRMFDADSLETCIRMVSRDRLPFLMGERLSLSQTLQAQTAEVIALFAAPQVVETRKFHFFITKALDQTTFGPLIRKATAQRKLTDYISRYADTKP